MVARPSGYGGLTLSQDASGEELYHRTPLIDTTVARVEAAVVAMNALGSQWQSRSNDLANEEILERLLALNLEQAGL